MKEGKRFSSLVTKAAIKQVHVAWNLFFSLAFGVIQ